MDDFTSIKITDFGLSYKVNEDSKYNLISGKCGTFYFMAPE